MRYQVFYAGNAAGKRGGLLNVATRRDAEREKRRLEQEGYQKVSIWGTQENSLSRVFELNRPRRGQ